MDELHRQKYLSALGVDTYMPRWHLPFAPQSSQCHLMTVEQVLSPEILPAVPVVAVVMSTVESQSATVEMTHISHTVHDIFEGKKSGRLISNSERASSTAANTPVSIEPFNLSIWRFTENTMVIDARNTKLALPTASLLKNIVSYVFPQQPVQFQEEVLRWPMIENSFAKRTSLDARNELQTWLVVQHEIRPIKYLWLMGDNAINYFLPEDSEKLLFDTFQLAGISISALLLPSLNELLLQPVSKQKLFSAIQRYYA